MAERPLQKKRPWAWGSCALLGVDASGKEYGLQLGPSAPIDRSSSLYGCVSVSLISRAVEEHGLMLGREVQLTGTRRLPSTGPPRVRVPDLWSPEPHCALRSRGNGVDCHLPRDSCCASTKVPCCAQERGPARWESFLTKPSQGVLTTASVI